MKVKIFDEGHEKDLEASINDFLENFNGEIIDIKYQTEHNRLQMRTFWHRKPL